MAGPESERAGDAKEQFNDSSKEQNYGVVDPWATDDLASFQGTTFTGKIVGYCDFGFLIFAKVQDRNLKGFIPIANGDTDISNFATLSRGQTIPTIPDPQLVSVAMNLPNPGQAMGMNFNPLTFPGSSMLSSNFAPIPFVNATPTNTAPHSATSTIPNTPSEIPILPTPTPTPTPTIAPTPTPTLTSTSTPIQITAPVTVPSTTTTTATLAPINITTNNNSNVSSISKIQSSRNGGVKLPPLPPMPPIPRKSNKTDPLPSNTTTATKATTATVPNTPTPTTPQNLNSIPMFPNAPLMPFHLPLMTGLPVPGMPTMSGMPSMVGMPGMSGIMQPSMFGLQPPIHTAVPDLSLLSFGNFIPGRMPSPDSPGKNKRRYVKSGLFKKDKNKKFLYPAYQRALASKDGSTGSPGDMEGGSPVTSPTGSVPDASLESSPYSGPFIFGASSSGDETDEGDEENSNNSRLEFEDSQNTDDANTTTNI